MEIDVQRLRDIRTDAGYAQQRLAGYPATRNDLAAADAVQRASDAVSRVTTALDDLLAEAHNPPSTFLIRNKTGKGYAAGNHTEGWAWTEDVSLAREFPTEVAAWAAVGMYFDRTRVTVVSKSKAK